jgi:glycosyltransferase involved in cell wall biosynthesis
VRVLAYVHGSVPYLQAGSETMLQGMMRGLQAAGHEVAVLSAGKPGRVANWRVEGVPSHCRPGTAAADRFAAQWAPEVIVTHHVHGLHATGLARGLGAASVAILHNDFGLSHKIIAAKPDLVVCNTKWIARRLAPSRHGVRSVVIHPTVDPAQHATTPGGMVTMVNFFRIKGPETFWRLARACPQYQFLAVKGGYGKQDLRPGHQNVTVIGTTTDMRRDVWSRTKVLLVPSRYESYGRVGIEACASRIPVIAAPTPGLRESLGRGAVFVPRSSPNEWHRRLRTLMESPAAYARAQAAAGARITELDHAAEIAAWVGAVESLPLPRRTPRPALA